jgi:sodium/potassium-transporting ATPase subunit alpha
LLGKCNQYLAADGSIKPMDDFALIIINRALDTFAQNVERVLGLAEASLHRSVAEEEAQDPHWLLQLRASLEGTCVEGGGTASRGIACNLVFVGLVSLQDPPREEVAAAVDQCRNAGIKVVMVTGDHPATAEAIARNIGLITLPTVRSLETQRSQAACCATTSGLDAGSDSDSSGESELTVGAVVVHGNDMHSFSQDDWTKLVNMKEIVFARTSPENKLTIVNEFKRAGHVVAMTGDGVNDSPALKQADIGELCRSLSLSDSLSLPVKIRPSLTLLACSL